MIRYWPDMHLGNPCTRKKYVETVNVSFPTDIEHILPYITRKDEHINTIEFK